MNSFLFKRKTNGATITVEAFYIEPMHMWGVSCKVNERHVDHAQSDDPWFTARAMIEQASMNLPVGT